MAGIQTSLLNNLYFNEIFILFFMLNIIDNKYMQVKYILFNNKTRCQVRTKKKYVLFSTCSIQTIVTTLNKTLKKWISDKSTR